MAISNIPQKNILVQAKKIKTWLDQQCDLSSENHRGTLGRMLLCIYDRQTNDEKRTEMTKEYNGVGFQSCHGNIGTSLGKQYRVFGRLSEKQWYRVHKMMKKYTRQLAEDYLARNN